MSNDFGIIFEINALDHFVYIYLLTTVPSVSNNFTILKFDYSFFVFTKERLLAQHYLTVFKNIFLFLDTRWFWDEGIFHVST